MRRFTESRTPLAEGNEGIAQTLARMKALIRDPGDDVRLFLERMPFQLGDAGVEDIFYWVRGHLLYEDHPRNEQTLITPGALLGMIDTSPDHKALGDCVSYAILFGALVYPRVPLRLVVRSTLPDQVFNHVYTRVQLSSGWVPADAASEAALGWEEDAADITAREDVPVW